MMNVMFTRLAIEFSDFVKTRDWDRYHHPKNLILNTFVELSELSEFLASNKDVTFIDLKENEAIFEGIKDEIGDLLINLVHFATKLNIEINPLEKATLKDDPSPSQVLHKLQATIRYLAEPLIWISEEASFSFIVPEDMPQILRESISLTLYFTDKLTLDPLETALAKLEKIKKKFPVDFLPEDVTELHKQKTKDRKPTY